MEQICREVGAQIRRLRKARRLTQAELADRIGTHEDLIGRLERGEQNPTLTTLAAVAAALHVEMVDLVMSCPPPTSLLS